MVVVRNLGNVNAALVLVLVQLDVLLTLLARLF